LSNTARIVPASDIYGLIGVRDPYFALGDVAIGGDGNVEAEVPIEQKSVREASVITAAEAARHMGLLGSVAAATVNPKKGMHYYIAREAVLERGPALLTSNGRKLQARGSATMTGSEAEAEVTLHDRSGALLYTLRVQFGVLDQKDFDHVLAGVKKDLRRQSRPGLGAQRPSGELRAMRANPYGAPLELRNMDQSGSGDVAEATFGPIDAASCNGHYPMHPVLPVGIVMSALSQLCGELLCRRAKQEVKYSVRHAAATAEAVAVGGETVRFGARYVSGSSKTRLFKCQARAGDKIVGTMSLTLTTI
jgi:3-hydroxymyristoyl/3-hydroxydecanoyl-(acyl carrier protein) dehydratase